MPSASHRPPLPRSGALSRFLRPAAFTGKPGISPFWFLPSSFYFAFVFHQRLFECHRTLPRRVAPGFRTFLRPGRFYREARHLGLGGTAKSGCALFRCSGDFTSHSAGIRFAHHYGLRRCPLRRS